jgi:hypothetical protein
MTERQTVHLSNSILCLGSALLEVHFDILRIDVGPMPLSEDLSTTGVRRPFSPISQSQISLS